MTNDDNRSVERAARTVRPTDSLINDARPSSVRPAHDTGTTAKTRRLYNTISARRRHRRHGTG